MGFEGVPCFLGEALTLPSPVLLYGPGATLVPQKSRLTGQLDRDRREKDSWVWEWFADSRPKRGIANQRDSTLV